MSEYTSPLANFVNRDPWIISCESWMSAGKYIALTLNPEQIDFNVPLRVAKDAGNNCEYIYIWRRRRNRSMSSNMTMSFQLSSGNIFPQFNLSTAQAYELARQYTGNVPPSESMVADHRMGRREYSQSQVTGLYSSVVPIGVQNLYALLALANEKRIRSSGEIERFENKYEDPLKLKQQTANRIVMGISTLVFPRLMLYGWFSPDGISFSLNADNPGEFSVNFTLNVTNTTPHLGFDAWRQLTESYNKNMFSDSKTLDWMAGKLGSKTIQSNLKMNGPDRVDPAGSRPNRASPNDDQTI